MEDKILEILDVDVTVFLIDEFPDLYLDLRDSGMETLVSDMVWFLLDKIKNKITDLEFDKN